MTRRERMEARLAKRAEWADKAKVAAAGRFDAAHRALDGIPPGQPILVGHHSEGRHRRAIERHDDNMAAGVERAQMASRHAEVAATLERRLDSTVFSDDPDAIPALEARIAEREAECERIRALNVAIRREVRAGLTEGWLARTGATEAEQREMLRNLQHSWRHEPTFPTYVLTNLRGRIAADKERIRTIRAQAARVEAAEAAGGVSVTQHGDYCAVTFAEKPSRDVLGALKAAGFRWGGGSWYGRRDALPPQIKEGV